MKGKVNSMKKFEYVVRKYSNGGCYDSAVFTTVKAARSWITGSPFATIERTANAYYGDNWSGWHAGADGVAISTGRKCDEVTVY